MNETPDWTLHELGAGMERPAPEPTPPDRAAPDRDVEWRVGRYVRPSCCHLPLVRNCPDCCDALLHAVEFWKAAAGATPPATPSAAAIDAAINAFAWANDKGLTSQGHIRHALVAAYAIDARPAPLTVERLAALLDEVCKDGVAIGVSSDIIAQRLLPRLTGATE